MSEKVRVRFAPSPTGPLHIGGVRTALFNYLYAKKHHGTFVLRIEDTDQKRYVAGAEDYIQHALDWCNIPYDEGPKKDGGFGPYRQSERKHLYKDYADQLLASGHAYYAFDTAEALNAHRKTHEAKGKTFIYNWHNRQQLQNALALSTTEVQDKLHAGADYVIRFKTPQDEILSLEDEIRGTLRIDTNILDDKILFKSDGMPTYHLANIVDDHLMEITHVIRGEEWLPSLALHVLLYRAFDWTVPSFAHLPLILKPAGKGKLSKRDGDKMGFPVFPLQWTDPKTKDIATGYKEDGYLPEAVINMLAFLGWNPGTEQEIFNLQELITAFDLERVHKSGAKFDPEKTKWFQQHYFQKLTDKALINAYNHLLVEKKISTTIDTSKVALLIKERATFINDLWELSHFFYQAPDTYDAKASKKAWKEDTPTLMTEVLTALQGLENFDAKSLTTHIKTWMTAKAVGFGKVMMPLRLALVGSLKGPNVFEIASLLGKKETIDRIKKALKTL